MRKLAHGVAFVAVVLASPVGCRSQIPLEDIEAALARGMGAAHFLAREGKYPEAAEVTRQVLLVDPSYPGAQELLDSLPLEHHSAVFVNRLLGSNVAKRLAADRSTPVRVMLYLPDRILDLFDVVSADLHVGPGMFFNAHVTRAIQFGAGARTVSGLGWHDHRSLGLLLQIEAGVAAPAMESVAFAGGSLGSSGMNFAKDELRTGLPRPSSPAYQQLRDYWAVGAAITAFVVGADFDFHPIELVDFLAGFATIDPLRDDFAITRGLDMTRGTRDCLWELAKITASEDSMEVYQASR